MRGLVFGVFGALALLPQHAAAKPAPMPGSGDISGRVRLSLGLDAAYYQARVQTPRQQGDYLIREQTVGLFGYRRIPGSISAAVALNEWVAIGARVGWAFEPLDDTLTIHGSVSPFAQVFFARDRNVRPFALVRAGIGRGHTFERSAGGSARAIGPRELTPSVGVGLGAHVFLTEAVSFDAMVVAEEQWRITRPLAGGPEGQQNPSRAASWQYEDARLGASLTIGVSSWF